jgi:hypothetical protein
MWKYHDDTILRDAFHRGQGFVVLTIKGQPVNYSLDRSRIGLRYSK